MRRKKVKNYNFQGFLLIFLHTKPVDYLIFPATSI